MRTPSFRHAAVAVTLIGIGAAIALADWADFRLGQTTVAQPVELTPMQRRVIYRSIMRERPFVVEPLPPENLIHLIATEDDSELGVTIGSPIPPGTELHAMPNRIRAQIPALRDHRYAVLHGRVFAVEPVSGIVVAEAHE